MANRRMFSKGITNSSEFLMMSQSAQNLYFHFGMNADDDGFCEVFTIMRMTESKPDDLQSLHSRGFVFVIDGKVCIVKDWHENNLIKNDRYQKSKYLDDPKYNEIYKTLMEEKIKEIALYKTFLLTSGSKGSKMVPYVITDGSVGVPQVRVGKGRIGKERTGEERTVQGTRAKALERASPADEVIPTRVEYGQPDINWLVAEFETVMGFKSASNRDRMFAKHLLKNFSRQELTHMLQYCSQIEYAPRIGSLEKMWFKRGDILAGLKSAITNNNKPKKQFSITI